MPIYQYKAVKDGCEYCRDGFEQLQSMKARPLVKCPQCGGAVKKCPCLCSGFTPTLSDGNLRDKGFTKLVKKDRGVYEKTT